MPDAGYGEERAIGRVVSVSNYRLTVLLDPDTRSQVRSYPHNIAVITQIGGYLVFPASPGVLAVGIIVGASEDEAFEPDGHGVMTLQLTRARRLVRLNLLGQLKLDEPFIPGISTYPTLDTPALLPTADELTGILRFKPSRSEESQNIALSIGQSPIYGQQAVMASYNDMLSRPFGVVGNTGSGKSCSVARLIQAALAASDGDRRPTKAKFIILDVNGEYGRAFGVEQSATKELNAVYVNGQRFFLPLWTFNLNELIAFFEASQASQVPVLERVITEIRENSIDEAPGRVLRRLVRLVETCNIYVDTILIYLDAPTKTFCGQNLKNIVDHLNSMLNSMREHPPYEGYVWPTEVSTMQTANLHVRSVTDAHNIPPGVVAALTPIFEAMRIALNGVRSVAVTTGGLKEVTADSPVHFDSGLLMADEFFTSATARFRGQERMQEYLSTLRLRIHRQLADKRWSVFTSGGADNIADLVNTILDEDTQVSVVDCSMLAHDVLPCFCAVFGRVLLDLRTRAEPRNRTDQPFALILEEAHNYLRPHRQEEIWGVRLSRDAFERISKEGRKFGISLIIASQRPSDVSATVLSQCANFLIHRIQNPEDIEYFKRILPLGSKDLLDQLPILAPGEGLLLGSAVNVPSRIRVRKPDPSPESETSRPWAAWQANQPVFDRETALRRWIADTTQPAQAGGAPPDEAAPGEETYDNEPRPEEPYEPSDDDVPF